MSERPSTRGLSGQDFIRPAEPPERTARWLAIGLALGLLLIAVWTMLEQRPAAVAHTAPTWTAIAPAHEIPLATWRWLVISGQRGADVHFAISAAPGDPAHLTIKPGWLLQRGASGYPIDALVIAIPGRADDPLVAKRLADLSAELVHHIPTLTVRRVGGDRHGAPIAFDAERTLAQIRERMIALNYPIR